MLSLTILLILILIFVALATRHWKTTIGAGPTILIVGAIVISAYWVFKWADYQQRQREYDVCFARVERAQEIGVFNTTLVNIILREFPDRQDIGEELRAVMVEPQTLEKDCPTEPTFWSNFADGF